jgi:hypothetical protein
MEPQRKMDGFAFARNDIDTASRSRRMCASFAVNVLAPKERAQGMPGPMHPQPRVENKKHASVVTTVTLGLTRHSPRNGFTASFVLSPVTGLVCHRHRQNCFRRIDASVVPAV